MKAIPPNIHNFTGHVWTQRGLQQVERAAITAAITNQPQSVTIEVMRGDPIKATVAPNGMVTC